MNTRTDKLIAIIAAPIVLAIAAILAFTTLTGHTHHAAPNLVDQWTTNVLHADHTYQPKFRTQAIRLCDGLQQGTITDNDMRLLVWPEQEDPNNPTTYTPAEMLTFEYASIEQYCPEQAGSLPVNVTN